MGLSVLAMVDHALSHCFSNLLHVHVRASHGPIETRRTEPRRPSLLQQTVEPHDQVDGFLLVAHWVFRGALPLPSVSLIGPHR
mmetsp:Transcript_6454/g.7843  ORF Transcript_6454/g.7843 Transcript_6454/m.7843 type:complete len:83 (-) Transcript_6454:746-994(-)